MSDGRGGLGASSALERLLQGAWAEPAARDALLREALGSAEVGGLVRLLLSGDEEVRRAAMVRLRRVGSAAMVDALLQEAPRHEPEAVLVAVELLALIAPPGSAQRAAWFLPHADPRVRAAAEAFVLAGALDRDVLSVLLGWVQVESDAARALRVLELLRRDLRPEEVRQPEILQALKRGLLHPAPEVRQRACHLLAYAESPEVAPALIAQLTSEEGPQRDELLRALRRVLQSASPAQRGQALAPLLVALDVEVRCGVAQLMVEDEQAVESLFAAWRALSGMPPWLQQRAVSALDAVRHRLEPEVVRALQRGDDAARRAALQCATALELTGPGVEEGLTLLLQGSEAELRWQATLALARLGSAATLPALLRSWQEREEPATLWALGWLGQRLMARGEEAEALSALRPLAEVAARGPAPARRGALAALARAPHPSVLVWLEEAQAASPDAAARREVWAASRWLGAALDVEALPAPAEDGAPSALQALVDAAQERGARAVEVAPGHPPRLLRDGRWRELAESPRRSGEEVARVLREAMPEEVAAEVAQAGQASWTPNLRGVQRAEVSAARHGVCGLLHLRVAPRPTLRELGLEARAAHLASLKSGLGLISAPRGGGRTATLAALLEHLARTRPAQLALVGALWEEPLPRGFALPLRVPTAGLDDAGVAEALVTAWHAGAQIVALDHELGPQTRRACLELAASGALVLSTTTCWRRRALLDTWAEAAAPLGRALEEVLAFWTGQLLLPGSAPGSFLAAVELVLAPDDAPGWLARAQRGALPPDAIPLEQALQRHAARGLLDAQQAERALDRWSKAQRGPWRSAYHVE